jgi:sugar phosphate isomerase/epimerase
MRTLSLAHLTLVGSSPLQLIDHAAEAGFTHIGMRVIPPTADARIASPVEDPALRTPILRRLGDAGLEVLDIEALWLSAEFDPAPVERAFAFGVEMGARYAIVAGNDPDHDRLLRHLDAVCQLGASFGIKILLEFIPYTQVRTIWDAANCLAIIDRPNTGILVDALHLSRSGGSIADVVANLSRVQFLHLCDAPASTPQSTELLRDEARRSRLYPGQGELALRELIAATPASIPIAIEAPHAGLADRPFGEQARLARETTVRLLREVDGVASNEQESDR